MPNLRGMQILQIKKIVKDRNSIKIDDLVNYLSTHEPFMKPITALKLIDDMLKGIDPLLEMNERDEIVLSKAD